MNSSLLPANSPLTKVAWSCLLAALAFATPAVSAPAAAGPPPEFPVKIIFDTDMGNDIDDALALALLHALQSRGVCELLAVTLTCPLPEAAPYVAAVNTFYGRPGIPVGVTPDAPKSTENRYLAVASRRGPDGLPLFPSTFDPAAAPRSVALLRRVLAEARDGEIVIVQVGFSTNLARLLDTPPDGVSPLPGRELARRKVRLLSVMAGRFPHDGGGKPYSEFNVKRDIVSARKLADEWPVPILWSDWNVGMAVRYPAWSIDRDFGYVPHHPVKEAYQAYRATPHERPCWDLTSVACVVWPDRGYFGTSASGRVKITPEGHALFTPEEGGRDVYLTVDQTQGQRLREVFAALTAEPPHGHRAAGEK
jgi:inosine-uridine nucleoside N-ribohydrolase